MESWSEWMFWAIVALFLIAAPFSWYANQAGHKAVEEGRGKRAFGQVPLWVRFAEVKRLADEGRRFAKVTLIVMKISFVLPLLVMVGFFVVPILKRSLNIE